MIKRAQVMPSVFAGRAGAFALQGLEKEKALHEI